MRFRRSIKLAPGFRLNFSGSGLSTSVGPRGASMTFGSRGTFFNAGIPGTGLSSRRRIDGSASARSAGAAAAPSQGHVVKTAVVSVTDEGEVVFRDEHGDPLPDFWIDKAKRQSGPAIRAMIETACEKLNATGKAAAEIHLDTPAPSDKPAFVPQKFSEPKPAPAAVQPHGLLGWLLKSVARRIDEENASRQRVHDRQLEQWEAARTKFAAEEERRRRFLEEEILHDVGAMSAMLEDLLQAFDWPRETSVDFEVQDGGAKVMIDVDLPEIEDMPRRAASLPARGYKVTMKDLSDGQVQKHYMAHVHGLGFRIIGEVFAALQATQLVVLSAYSQRPDKATGAVCDEFLYSVRVARSAWQGIDFANLASIDVVQALARFDLRRDMNKSGAFSAIEPFAN